eukprot:TRINITY_DN9451_c0_g1_i1.p1 TRINITY_DN9451_c0_g1~~TRINITY_DN9451_c0_g1_i1.p1  ORF type:complete len:132 (+),score=24.25 TRINITY_DN9451_c0_g1_i1:863-1258(+)
MSKRDVFARFKSSLGFENTIDYDYATEKFYQALQLGIVPVTLGPPNIAELVPHLHSYIDATHCTPKQLADYLSYLDKNDTAYQEYFAWRREPMLEGFERQLDETLLYMTCRLFIKVANQDIWDFIPQAKEA